MGGDAVSWAYRDASNAKKSVAVHGRFSPALLRYATLLPFERFEASLKHHATLCAPLWSSLKNGAPPLPQPPGSHVGCSKQTLR